MISDGVAILIFLTLGTATNTLALNYSLDGDLRGTPQNRTSSH